MKSEVGCWVTCSECQGRGRKSKRLRKKVRLNFQRALEAFEKSNGEGPAPVRPKPHLDLCSHCSGSGLLRSPEHSLSDIIPDTKNYPKVAIIGGGIGGVALAVACLHRGIPFTLYERDSGFEARSQGYGLTLQQASKAIEGLGIFSLAQGIVSTRHVVHNTEGRVLGEWGVRKWVPTEAQAEPKRTNIHIARQLLRKALLEQLGEQFDEPSDELPVDYDRLPSRKNKCNKSRVQWNHQLIDFKQRSEKYSNGKGVELNFQVQVKDEKTGTWNKQNQTDYADLVVGADGIRSAVRKTLITEEASPLQYLGCIVILGICPLADIKDEYDDVLKTDSIKSDLLDSATVFQTANGHERMYIMPFTSNSVMWQLSFPMEEGDAKKLSAQGPEALKQEAIKRCQWHSPIPQIIKATQAQQVSGYPAYDRALLEPHQLEKGLHATLIGDAAHPMSPFKGQGANQALLDALSLARTITRACRSQSNWREAGIRASVLTEFETEMLQRSSKKVKESAEAAEFLHTESVLNESDAPRGRNLVSDN